ncbi:hypothetical protein vseg_020005 [Gypsophila vaccaria]
MSIAASIRPITITRTTNFRALQNPQLFLSPSSFFKPFISQFPESLTASKSRLISFQNLPTKPQSSSSASSIQPIEELPPKLQEIVKLFQSVDNPRAKYQQLLFYANNLPKLDGRYKTKENKVEGCVSQVWVRAFLDENYKDRVHYEADSDSVMTKGLAALLVLGLSGQPISEIVRVTPDFVTLLGLQQNLTPSRNNGFLNMLRLMQRKALLLGLEAEKQGSSSSGLKGGDGGVNELIGDDLSVKVVDEESEDAVEEFGSSRKSDDGDGDVGGAGRIEIGGRGGRIKEVLERELKPVKLEIEDVSYQHAGHVGVRGTDGETHFNLKIVSDEFQGKSLVKRHRMIYNLLQDELQSGLHALSIVAKTTAEVDGGS